MKNNKNSKGIRFLPNDAAAYDEINSPVGKLTVVTSPKGLCAILWDVDRKNPKYEERLRELRKSEDERVIAETKKQLNEYFQGKRKTFDLPIAMNGTDFQIQAWNQLLKIPYGSTISYAEQAKRIGDKKKARAVGMANGNNPISIVIPCHRVIGSNGHLVGFGGGIEKKEFLLQLEKSDIFPFERIL